MDNPGADNWQPYIPHQLGTLMLGFEVYQDYMVRLERVNALPQIVIREFTTGDEHTIALDEEAYGLGLSGVLEYHEPVMRFGILPHQRRPNPLTIICKPANAHC